MAHDVTLHDNWQVNGLRGTGSQNFSVTGVFVPHEHAFDFRAPAARSGVMYRISVPGFMSMDHGAEVGSPGNPSAAAVLGYIRG
jgi:indole-3-acetate monooxygenase